MTVQVRAASVHVPALKLPLALLLHVIVPPGVPAVPLVSVTVAVQVVVVPAVRLAGVHVTPVLVPRLTTRFVVPLLPTWPGAGIVSPP